MLDPYRIWYKLYKVRVYRKIEKNMCKGPIEIYMFLQQRLIKRTLLLNFFKDWTLCVRNVFQLEFSFSFVKLFCEDLYFFVHPHLTLAKS